MKKIYFEKLSFYVVQICCEFLFKLIRIRNTGIFKCEICIACSYFSRPSYLSIHYMPVLTVPVVHEFFGINPSCNINLFLCACVCEFLGLFPETMLLRHCGRSLQWRNVAEPGGIGRHMSLWPAR